MDFKMLSSLQFSFDEQHGFRTEFDTQSDTFQQVTKDLVGLFGELGEFANIVKKINIKLDHPDDYDFDITSAKPQLEEELADTFIYLIRIATTLKIDLEQEVVKKIDANKSRYAKISHK